MPSTVVPPNPGTELWRQYLDHGYLSSYAINRNGQLVANGDEVASIPDQIGNVPLLYAGEEFPLFDGKWPLYFQDLTGMVWSPNESRLGYLSAIQPSPTYLNGSREAIYVLALSNYQIFEAFNNTDGIEYWGDRAASGIRTKSSPDFDGDETWAYNFGPMTNRVSVVSFTYYNNVTDSRFNDKVYAKVSINGVENPTLMTTYKVNEFMGRLGFGAYTNNTHSGMIFCGFRRGTPLSDSVKSSIINELIETYNGGQEINLPWANNLQIVNNGTNNTQFTATYTFKSIGFPEDVSRRKVKWVYTYGGVGRACYIPELENRITFNSKESILLTATHQERPDGADIPQDDPDYRDTVVGYDIDLSKIGLSVELVVYDTQGNHYSIAQKIFVGV